MILDGRVIAASSLVGMAGDPRAYLHAFYPEVGIPPLDHVVLTAAPLVARVNHGRWIASCSCGAKGLPTPGCVVFLDVPFGWCVRCGNRAWGGGWRPIVLPPEPERRLIEAILDSRPNVGDRNWEPDETIELLMAENTANGDPVPDLDLVRIGPLHGPDVRGMAARFPPADAMRQVLDQSDGRGRLRRLLRR